MAAQVASFYSNSPINALQRLDYRRGPGPSPSTVPRTSSSYYGGEIRAGSTTSFTSRSSGRSNQSSATSVSSSSQQARGSYEPGYVPGFPPRDFFTSGASRIRDCDINPGLDRRAWGTGDRSGGGGSIARILENEDEEEGDDAGEYEDEDDDEEKGVSVTPWESISQVSSARLRAYGRRSNTGRSMARTGGSERLYEEGGNYPKLGDNAGYEQHERPVFDQERGYYVRLITPSGVRGRGA